MLPLKAFWGPELVDVFTISHEKPLDLWEYPQKVFSKSQLALVGIVGCIVTPALVLLVDSSAVVE